jgi:hypothetical protein
VGLKVRVSKCKLWNPLGLSLAIENPRGCALVIDGLCILGVTVGFKEFAMHVLDEALS